MKNKLPEPNQMLIESFREFNSVLSTLNESLGMLNEAQSDLADNLNKYQEQLDSTIWKTGIK